MHNINGKPNGRDDGIRMENRFWQVYEGSMHAHKSSLIRLGTITTSTNYNVYYKCICDSWEKRKKNNITQNCQGTTLSCVYILGSRWCLFFFLSFPLLIIIPRIIFTPILLFFRIPSNTVKWIAIPFWVSALPPCVCDSRLKAFLT